MYHVKTTPEDRCVRLESPMKYYASWYLLKSLIAVILYFYHGPRIVSDHWYIPTDVNLCGIKDAFNLKIPYNIITCNNILTCTCTTAIERLNRDKKTKCV